MSLPAPDIDSRNSADITRQVVELAKIYAPSWKEYDPETNAPKGLSAAIIGSFARFCEIVIQRVNQVPYKNILAFFDILGATQEPPQPSRVPLTFFSSAGSTNAAVVPAATRVAAPPDQGEKDPVIFETETELVVSPSKLINVFTRDPFNDKYADLGAVLESVPAEMTVFEGTISNEHILFIGNSLLLGLQNIKSVTLHFDLEAIGPLPDQRDVVWENLDGSSVALVVDDETGNLTQSGAVSFGSMEPVELSLLNGTTIMSRWLCCRLLTPVIADPAGKDGMVRETHIPKIKSVSLDVTFGASEILPQNAVGTVAPFDLTNPIYPFGEKPKFGDTLYLSSDQAFSLDNNTIGISITIVNPTGSSVTSPKPVKASSDLSLVWEYWNSISWISPVGINDGTNNFSKSGTVSFTIPASTAQIPAPVRKMIAGIDSFWIRVRIEKGNYGNEAYYTPVDPNDLTKGYAFHPADFAPPIVNGVTINYSKSVTNAPVDIVSRNDFSILNISESLKQNINKRTFSAMPDSRPALYAGFSLPAPLKKFPNRPFSFYMRMVDHLFGETSSTPVLPISTEPLKVSWEYWNGSGYIPLSANDGSENLTGSGIIELLPPSDFTEHSEFDINAFWIRAVWKSGKYTVTPILSHILLNTVMASQTITLRDELLGSSDQSESQSFKTSYSPVLIGQKLMVRESEMPSGDDLTAIINEEGEDAIVTVTNVPGKPREIWVRWHEVNDFYSSGPRDRHYCLDHLTGAIHFGDSVNGMIPPQGAGNIKMAFYQTGGGERGNRAASTITQLKTTLPYIEKVVNTEASGGGADAETVDSLIERAPAALRHGNRSVALEDYEDLAKLASYGVARAKCYPLFDLKTDPYTSINTPGVVSVIIVPRTVDKKPVPTLELVNRVQNYLLDHCVPTADVYVVGPLYLSVDVTVEIVLSTLDGASELEATISDTIAAFLHPLTGGVDGKGWEFGRLPQKSDIYALLSPIPNIDHITRLTIDTGKDQKDQGNAEKNTGRFLVCSGNHTINMKFE